MGGSSMRETESGDVTVGSKFGEQEREREFGGRRERERERVRKKEGESLDGKGRMEE